GPKWFLHVPPSGIPLDIPPPGHYTITLMQRPPCMLLLLSALAVPFSLPSARAALLVSESYDSYTPQAFSTTGSAAIDTGVTANAQGLAGNYIVNNPGGGSGFSFSAGGLAFGSYNSAAGNKLEFKTNGGG